jgi:RHS repeat-associated protein
MLRSVLRVEERSGEPSVPASCGLTAGHRDKLAKDGQRAIQDCFWSRQRLLRAAHERCQSRRRGSEAGTLPIAESIMDFGLQWAEKEEGGNSMPRITIRPASAGDRSVRQVVRGLLSRRMRKVLCGLCLATALLPAQAQEVYYIHTDALGSPVAETDANRNVVARFEYEPYGRRLSGSNDDKPGYTGHVMDAVTGLVQMQQRYYDPGIGRMLSVDPVTAYGGDMRLFNRYVYAFNNPYTFTDPDGRWPSQKGFYVHQDAIGRVIGPHVSKFDLAILKRSQAIADAKQYQDGASSFRHAMRSGGQTVEDARAMANQFVRAQFDKAWSAPTREQSLIEFGIGLHALQDATSPAHAGFQQWTGEETWGETLGHIRKELYDPGSGSSLDNITQQAWDAFQKGELPKGDLFGGGFQGVFRVGGRIDSKRLDNELKGK